MRAPASAREIGLICALFLPSFLATWIGTVLISKLVTRLLSGRDDADAEDKSLESGIEKGLPSKGAVVGFDMVAFTDRFESMIA